MNPAQEERLWQYLDGLLTPPEKAQVEQELQRSTELRERLEVLRQISQHLHQGKLEQPSRQFIARVMDNLKRKPSTSGLSPRNGLLLLLGIVVAILAVSFLTGTGSYDSETLVPLNEVTLPGKLVPQNLPSFSVNSKWVINGLMVVAMALAFVVLDRTVLRPIFNKRLGHS